jgi:hypothetical protein
MADLGSGEVHFRFRPAPRFGPIHKFVGWRPELDGIRVQDDGSISIAMGKRILLTTAGNVNGIEPVDHLLWPLVVGVRRLPGSRSVTFATDAGSGLLISFREPVKSAIGVLYHHRVTVTIERPTELLPAVLGARRNADEAAADETTGLDDTN